MKSERLGSNRVIKTIKDALWVIRHPRTAYNLDKLRFIAEEHHGDYTTFKRKSLREINQTNYTSKNST